MQRKGWIASALFAAMCLAGVTTLLMQEGASGTSIPVGSGGGTTALDPAAARGLGFGEVVPLSLRKGAELQAEVSRKETADAGKILRLR